MKKIILILLAIVLLLTACGKKAEEPSEPTPSESETMPTESEPIPSESESDTEDATEPTDFYDGILSKIDLEYVKELIPVKIVENPPYRIEGYYSTSSEAFTNYPIIHGYVPSLALDLTMEKEFLPDDFTKDYGTEANGVIPKIDEERKYIDYLSPDSVVFKDGTKIPSAFAIEFDEVFGVLVELLATTDGERINNIGYYFTKVFAYGKLIDISEYLTGIAALKNAGGEVYNFQGDSVYFAVNGGRLRITEDEVSFTEGYWDYFYDEKGYLMKVCDEYGQEFYWGFHPRKKSEGTLVYPHYPDDIILPYWD